MQVPIVRWTGLALTVLTVSCSSDDTASAPPSPTCSPGFSACGTSCVDTKSNALNCGACGASCGVGQACSAGKCQCQSGLSACGSACVDIRSSAANCGACAAACSGTTVCSNGKCGTSCGSGETQCGKDCVNLANSALNCGACNKACATGQSCSNQACVCAGAGQTLCSGQCVSTADDRNHCGSCGNTCATGTNCQAGQCVSSGTGGSSGGGGSAGTGGTAGGGGITTGGSAGTGGSGNQPPVVNAGADVNLTLPANATNLTGSATDPDGTISSYAWTKVSGPKATMAGEATASLALSDLVAGTYLFRLTVTDNGGASASDDVQVSVIAASNLCLGTKYYVSASGNDASGDGSQANPWATLAKATASVTTAGSILHLNAGTYTETQQSELAPGVCIEGEGPATVIQSTLTADWTPIIHAVSPEGTDGHQEICHLKLDGQNLSTFWALEVGGRSNVSIHDITVVDFKDRGVIVTGRSDNVAAAPTIWATGNTFYNNTILNSAAYNTANGIYGRGCLNVGGTEGMLIYNNVITQNQRPEGYNGWPIKAANDGHNRGLKIYNNQLTKIPFTGSYPGENGWDFAVEMFNDQGTEFYGNTVNGAGFDTNWQTKGAYPYSLWIHDNVFSLPTVVNSYNTAITLEFDSDSVIVENNRIDNMSGCVLFTPRAGNTISNVTIVGNLCTHVSKGAGNGSNASFINAHAGQDNFNLNGLHIYNNTFLSDPANRPWWGIELGAPSVGTHANLEILNNILAHTQAGAITRGGVKMDQVNISNNDLYDIADTNDPVFNTPPSNYTYANNLHSDPQFTSDFHLQPGSPCINAGLDVGRPFNGSAPDIGAFETP